MASRCSRIFQRSSVSALKSAISKPAASSFNRSATAPSNRPSLFTSPVAYPLRRFSLSRMPAELGGVASLLPLHSAVATARMTSCLSSSSRSCRALSQGWWYETVGLILASLLFLVLELGLSVPR